MNQQHKLQSRLREYYEQERYSPSENEWEKAAAYLEKSRTGAKKKRRAIVFFFSGLLLLFTVFPFIRNAKSDQHNLQLTAVPTPAKHANTKHVESPDISAKADLRPHTTNQKMSTPVLRKTQDLPESSLKPVLVEQKVSDLVVSDPENLLSDNKIPPDEILNKDMITKEEAGLEQNYEVNERSASPAENNENKAVPVLPLPLTPAASGSAVNERQTDELLLISKDNSGSDSSLRKTEHIGTIPVPTQADSVNTAAQSALPEDTARTTIAKDAIYFEAGAAWMYGWQNKEGRDARGFVPQIGFGYSSSLSTRSSLSFGIYYTQVANLSASSKTSKESIFRYGEQSQITKVTPVTVHYLVLPLRYQYHIDQKNSVGGGLNFAYLMNVTAQVESYETRPGYRSESEIIRLDGYTQGFSWYDCQAAVFYRRRILPSLSIHAEVFYGLVDIKQDQFFDLPYKERNSGIKLSICYEMFRK